jgi:hypothetical protein
MTAPLPIEELPTWIAKLIKAIDSPALGPAVNSSIGQFAKNIAEGFDSSRGENGPAAIPFNRPRPAGNHRDARPLSDLAAGTASVAAADGHPTDNIFRKPGEKGDVSPRTSLNDNQTVQDQTDRAVELVAQQIILALAP